MNRPIAMGLSLNLVLADVLFVYPDPRANLGVQIGVLAGDAGVTVPIDVMPGLPLKAVPLWLLAAVVTPTVFAAFRKESLRLPAPKP